MNVEFDIASDQIDGARDYQEDAYMVSQLGDSEKGDHRSLVIMADGMGGHAAGNVASNMVVATFNKSFQSEIESSSAPTSLKSALLRANQQIRDSVSETPALRGMGCTMVSVFLEDDKLHWVSVGDSHLYLIRDRELIKQNADHSYGAYLDMMKEQGMEIEEQPGMSRNMLMSAMTGDEISSIDCPDSPIKLRPGDRLIIASDGLDTLGAGAIIQYSSWSNTARECVYALLKAVEEANKINQDNTTIIVADINESQAKSKKEPEKPAQSLSHSQPVIEVVEEAKSSFSFSVILKILVKWIIVFLLVGGVVYAWQQGMLQPVIEQIKSMLEPEQQQAAPQAEPQPPVPQPPVTREPVKQPAAVTQTPAATSETYTDRPDPFTDRLQSGGRGPLMIQIPGGSFRMGNKTGVLSADETPRHLVNVSSFYMSVNEVTVEEYSRFAKATGRSAQSANGDNNQYPVTDVTWDDAIAYTKWLSKQTRQKYRLPSESEWEYAARAGTNTTYWWGSAKGSGNAHCFDCGTDLSTQRPAKVGSYAPNQFGLYDTAGNVFEWTHDCYHRNYNEAPDDGSVWDGGDCSVRVARGGAFRSPASSMRVENREKFQSNKKHYNVGFRVVRD